MRALLWSVILAFILVLPLATGQTGTQVAIGGYIAQTSRGWLLVEETCASLRRPSELHLDPEQDGLWRSFSSAAGNKTLVVIEGRLSETNGVTYLHADALTKVQRRDTFCDMNPVGLVSVSAYPRERTVSQGGEAEYELNIENNGGASVKVEIAVLEANLPAATSYTLSPSTVDLEPGRTVLATLKILTDGTATPPADYTVIVKVVMATPSGSTWENYRLLALKVSGRAIPEFVGTTAIVMVVSFLFAFFSLGHLQARKPSPARSGRLYRERLQSLPTREDDVAP